MSEFLQVNHMKCQQVVEAKAKEVESESAMVVCGSCSAYDTNQEEKTMDCMLDKPDDQLYTDGPVAASVGLSDSGEDCLDAGRITKIQQDANRSMLWTKFNVVQTNKLQSQMQAYTNHSTEQFRESRNNQKYKNLHTGVFA